MKHLNVIMVSRHWDELGQTLAEPHSDVSLHVDGEGLKSLLQSTNGKIAQTANILAQVDTPHLRQAQCTHGDETWQTRNKTNEERMRKAKIHQHPNKVSKNKCCICIVIIVIRIGIAIDVNGRFTGKWLKEWTRQLKKKPNNTRTSITNGEHHRHNHSLHSLNCKGFKSLLSSRISPAHHLQSQCLWRPSQSQSHWSASLHSKWTWCSSLQGQSCSPPRLPTATGARMARFQCASAEPGKDSTACRCSIYKRLYLFQQHDFSDKSGVTIWIIITAKLISRNSGFIRIH